MEPRLELCPECGSHEVASDRIPHLGQQHDCPECGYQGSFVIEADSVEDARRIRRELRAGDDADEDDG